MPTYDYRCEECGHEFEEMLSVSRRKEPTQTPCTQRILDRNQDPQCFDCGGKIHLKKIEDKNYFDFSVETTECHNMLRMDSSKIIILLKLNI